MRRWVTVAWILSAALAGVAGAEPVRIRSGDHPGFTRLALEPQGVSDWSLGRIEGGYRLTVSAAGDGFDTTDTFRSIARARLASLVPGSERGAIDLLLACDCHAVGFQTGTGLIAIDIVDGPPQPGSSFEMPAATARPAASDPDPATAMEQRAPAAAKADAVHLDWPRLEQESRIEPASDWPQGSPIRGLPPLWEADTADDPTEHDGSDGAPAGDAVTLPLNLPQERDPRLAAAKDQLLLQIGRAASQGLVDAQLPERHDAGSHDLPPATPGEDSERRAPEPQRLPLSIRTSIDRAYADEQPALAMTPEGETCPPEPLVTVGDWGDPEAAADSIAALRRSLVGEFDQPNPAAIIDLARLYAVLGFGAETEALLQAFAIPEDQIAILRGIARIMDDEPLAPGDPMTRMSGCDGAAALWGLLAAPVAPAAHDMNVAAVTRAFSALPANLRNHLGARVVERLIAAGQTAAAQAVRDAMSRAGPASKGETELASARIDVAEGHNEDGLARLHDIAASASPEAYEAALMAAELRIAEGLPFDPADVELIASLAFERRNGPTGPAFARAEILAEAVSDRFTNAFAALERWRRDTPALDAVAVTRELAERLTGQPDDAVFAEQVFAHGETLRQADLPTELQERIAERLAVSGFPEEALRMTSAASLHDLRVRLQADAALRAGDPEKALALFGSLPEGGPAELRAQAETGLAHYRQAAASFAAAGKPKLAAKAAWAAGDWADAVSAGDAAERGAAVALGLIPAADTGHAPDAETAPDAPLAAATHLVQSSASLRAALAARLSDAPDAATAKGPAPGTQPPDRSAQVGDE